MYVDVLPIFVCVFLFLSVLTVNIPSKLCLGGGGEDGLMQNVATLTLTPNLATHSCWISWRYIPGLSMTNLSKSTCSNSPKSLAGPWRCEQGFTLPVCWNRSIYLLTDLSDRQSCRDMSLILRLWAMYSHTTLQRRSVEVGTSTSEGTGIYRADESSGARVPLTFKFSSMRTVKFANQPEKLGT